MPHARSSHTHSLASTKVTKYAQWATPEDYDRMGPDASPFLTDTLTIAKFDPGLHEVTAIFTPDAIQPEA